MFTEMSAVGRPGWLAGWGMVIKWRLYVQLNVQAARCHRSGAGTQSSVRFYGDWILLAVVRVPSQGWQNRTHQIAIIHRKLTASYPFVLKFDSRLCDAALSSCDVNFQTRVRTAQETFWMFRKTWFQDAWN
jgi:hypothetical protein